MRFRLTERALREYDDLTPLLQKRADKQFALLLRNLRHPSLRAKKFDEARDTWQARVDGHYRFYFQIRGDTYFILSINKHRD